MRRNDSAALPQLELRALWVDCDRDRNDELAPMFPKPPKPPVVDRAAN